MPEYLAPGVFVEEVSYRAKSIEGVSTTTTGFIGPTRDGPTALELARIAPPDLMLVDLMMPVMDGSVLIDRLRTEKLAEGIPIVIISADHDTRAKGESLHADAALRKPFELEELQGVVARLLTRPAHVPS
jgi:CheY-like chemotaxis protein